MTIEKFIGDIVTALHRYAMVGKYEKHTIAIFHYQTSLKILFEIYMSKSRKKFGHSIEISFYEIQKTRFDIVDKTLYGVTTALEFTLRKEGIKG